VWLVTGEIQKQGIVVHLVARRIDALDSLAGEVTVPSRDFH
jgi:NADP-dependent 3-hydroxy acid dehydrogenase YdfG